MKRIATILAIFSGFLTVGAQTEKEFKVHDELSNKQQVIGWPENMITQADELMQTWQAKHYLYPARIVKDNGTAPAYTSEQIQERLHRLPTLIEMSYNNVVQECVDKYAQQLRESVAIMLAAGNFYVPLFEEALDRSGLPLELKFLPVVESSLNPLATNSNGRKGLWQLPLSIAQRYALEINSLVDERLDPYKSTMAAVQYLKDLYAIYGNWHLVIAAYNSDPACVNKAIHRAGGKKEYWSVYPHLPQETRGFVPAFIAANYIMNFYCEHNISPLQTKIPIKTDTIMIGKNLHMKQIEALCDIKMEEIKALNPQYCTEVIPGASKLRVLRMPQEKVLTFIDHQDAIFSYHKDQLLTKRAVTPVDTREVAKAKEAKQAKYVTVRRGDTLGAIARRNNTTVRNIKRLNGMHNDRLSLGKRLRVR